MIGNSSGTPAGVMYPFGFPIRASAFCRASVGVNFENRMHEIPVAGLVKHREDPQKCSERAEGIAVIIVN